MDSRLVRSPGSLERAAAAGLQDSMPRAALLSIHARMSETGPDTWAKSPLVQVWGPRFSAYVVAKRDVALFTLGRLSDEPNRKQQAQEIADRLEAVLGEERMDVRDAARAMGVHDNTLRYAAPTGRFLIYWDGARQPLIWTIPAPAIEPSTARSELLRRYLHVFGPVTPASFASWAGIRPQAAAAAFDTLNRELITVQTPIGEGWIRAEDESAFRLADGAISTRLLPSGDTYYLLHGADRELLIPDAENRARLWTSRVWPGAVIWDGEIVGTWRRSGHKLTIELWQPVKGVGREAIAAEAVSMPLPGIDREITVIWEDGGSA